MLSSFLFAQFQSAQLTVSDGLLIGLQMNFRAAFMIVGFSVIGKELSNPVIRNFFLRTSFRQLPLALEIAFETLPFVIANLPSVKDIFKRPVGVIRQIVAQSEFWLQKVALTMKKKSNVVIITGEIGSGKTSLTTALAARFKEYGIKTGGIIAPAIFENGEKKGYNLIDLATNKIMPLSQTQPNKDMAQVGRYFFRQEAISFGREALSVGQNIDKQIVIIDEIGAWELQGQGWGLSLNDLIINSDIPLVLTVRKKFLEMVVESWMLQNPLVIDAKDASVDEVCRTISEFTCLEILNSTNY
jgi:nucleoside-triphosphatase THEP1